MHVVYLGAEQQVPEGVTSTEQNYLAGLSIVL
jgi:hypothetical protein